MDMDDFYYVVELVKSRIGVIIKPGQLYLVESRMAPLVRKLGMESIPEVVEKARENSQARINDMIIDVMTTNETLFFRDRVPFEHLRKAVLPNLAKNTDLIRIWCAACSFGQEPYSLAMMLDQYPELTGEADIEIVATDISDTAVQKAKQGLYSQFEIQRGLPLDMLMTYFTQEGDDWRISDKIRNKVSFMSHNLINPPTNMGKFNIVLCRNVLIYFEKETRRKVLDGIATQMPVDGYLLLGAAESALGLTSIFRESSNTPGLYQREAAAALVEGQAA